MVIFDYLKARIFDLRKNQAIRKAQSLADLHRRKYLVLVWKGKPVCISMQGVKKLIREKHFTGLTADKARSIALYEAIPRVR